MPQPQSLLHVHFFTVISFVSLVDPHFSHHPLSSCILCPFVPLRPHRPLSHPHTPSTIPPRSVTPSPQHTVSCDTPSCPPPSSPPTKKNSCHAIFPLPQRPPCALIAPIAPITPTGIVVCLCFRPSIRREQCNIARGDIYDGEATPSIS